MGNAKTSGSGAVSGKSYAQLRERIEDLIVAGTQVSNSAAGTPSFQIHEWVKAAEYCLLLLEDKLPTAVSDFRRIREELVFKVDEEEEETSSASAYRPEEGDVLLDFRFESLQKGNDILKLAATKLEFQRSPGAPPEKTLGEQLRSARQKAGHTQREAAKKIGCDPKDISEWERGERKPHPNNAKCIGDYIAKQSNPT